jgi:hypothetical protein
MASSEAVLAVYPITSSTAKLPIITWSCRLRPGEFAAGTNDSTDERQPAVHQQPHGDCGRVPAARRQAAEQRVFGGVLVHVERLGIELPGKGFDLRLVNDVRSTGEVLAHMQVVEIEPLVSALRVSFKHVTPRLPARCLGRRRCVA